MAMMNFAIGLTGLNLLILLVLWRIYFQNYKQIKADFSLGLLLFATMFIIQKIVTLYILIFTMFDVGDIVGNSMFMLEIFQSLAFSILLWITVK